MNIEIHKLKPELAEDYVRFFDVTPHDDKKQVCKDAAQDGFDFVEVYPNKEPSYQSSNFGGHFEMYSKNGFSVLLETEQWLVMRKKFL